SLCFDSEPLAARLVPLGVPELDLEFSVDRPAAFLAIRICDVKPDGASARVNLGLHNLTRMTDDRNPAPLEPGRRYRLKLPLDFKGYAFRAGHRIRVAISTTYWPMVWPSPEPVTLTIYRGDSSLSLPVYDNGGKDDAVTLGHDIALGRSLNRTDLAPPVRKRSVLHDAVTGETVLSVQDDNGTYRLEDIDWEVASSAEEVYRMVGNDPLSARADATFVWQFRRGGFQVTTETVSSLRCTRDAFICDLSLKAREGGSLVHERDWTFEIPRDHV
ncbi:MAG: peptidase S15, partial [Alphaproteobacteria bacterium]|nr:peptidase S15 [Alphaproteobacteria bacterium]